MRSSALLLFLIITFTGCASQSEDGTHKKPEVPAEVTLPGTQPESITFERRVFCMFCHGGYADYSPHDTWRGSMMSHAGRDPLYLAAMAASNKDFDGYILVGDYCLRCHTPKGWLEGRSEPVDGSALKEEMDDFDGIVCDFCHRMIDPLTGEGKSLSEEGTVDAYHNGQYVITDKNVKLGPYEPIPTGHVSQYSDIHTRSDLCGTCHEITNPVYGDEPIEKTYTEWKYSAYGLYAPRGQETTCQDCHMPPVEGYACNLKDVQVLRDNIYQHDFAGGTSCIQDMMDYIYDFQDKDIVGALARGKENAQDMLENAAGLDVEADGATLSVRVTNLAGHKLPTGYPEGRRMWLNVRFMDEAGDMIKESGAYDPDTAELRGDPEIKLYEAKPGIKNTGDPGAFPDLLGLPEGPGFHFAANNHIYQDNRIPPRGFTNGDFEREKAFIRGAEYADGQNWDISMYTIPEGAVSARVTLFYQTTTKEYVTYLRDANTGNPWDHFNMGSWVYDAWEATGKCPPTQMAEAFLGL